MHEKKGCKPIFMESSPDEPKKSNPVEGNDEPVLVRRFKPMVLAVSLALAGLGGFVLFDAIFRSTGRLDVGRAVAGGAALLGALLLATRMFPRACSRCGKEVVEGVVLLPHQCADTLQAALGERRAGGLQKAVQECGPVSDVQLGVRYASLDYEICPDCRRVGRFSVSIRVYQSREGSRVRVERLSGWRELSGPAVAATTDLSTETRPSEE